MTIKEFKDKYAKNISNSVLASIFKSLNIESSKVYDDSKTITDEEVKKLIYSNALRKNSLNSSIVDRYSSVGNGYSDLINKYNSLLEKDKNGNYIHIDPSSVGKITELRDRIIREQTDYKDFISRLKSAGNIDELFIDNGNGSIIDNELDKAVIGYQQSKINSLDDKLNSKYDKIRELQTDMGLYSSKIMKFVYQKKINKVQNKVNKLRNKKGKISSKQRIIINKNVSNYEQKILANFNLEKAEADGIVAATIEHKRLIDNSTSVANDISVNNVAISSLLASQNLGSKLKAIGKVIDNSKLSSSKRKVDDRISFLSKKIGTVNISSQLQVTHQHLGI